MKRTAKINAASTRRRSDFQCTAIRWAVAKQTFSQRSEFRIYAGQRQKFRKLLKAINCWLLAFPRTQGRGGAVGRGLGVGVGLGVFVGVGVEVAVGVAVAVAVGVGVNVAVGVGVNVAVAVAVAVGVGVGGGSAQYLPPVLK
jgi:hypothetical protein